MTRLLAAAAALVLLAAGCGGGSSRREAVTGYITNVNGIDAGLSQPAQAVAAATRALADPRPNYRSVGRRLRGAAEQIDALRSRIARVPAPVDATRLRSLLIELLSGEAGLARELAAYAAFSRAFVAALKPLSPAGTRLRQSLSGTTTRTTDAAALESYVAAIHGVSRRLAGLRPPPVSAPVRRTELRTLRHVQGAAEALARTLRTKQTSRIPALEHAFNVAIADNETLAAQRARIAAVKAFNVRVRSLATLTAKIDREQTKLQALLG